MEKFPLLIWQGVETVKPSLFFLEWMESTQKWDLHTELNISFLNTPQKVNSKISKDESINNAKVSIF